MKFSKQESIKFINTSEAGNNNELAEANYFDHKTSVYVERDWEWGISKSVSELYC